MIFHYSRLQSLVTTSTLEAELCELVRASKELLSLMGVAADMKFNIQQPHLLTDSKTSMDVINGLTLKRKTKHLATKVAYLRDLSKKLFNVYKVESKNNPSDIFYEVTLKTKFSASCETFKCPRAEEAC